MAAALSIRATRTARGGRSPGRPHPLRLWPRDRRAPHGGRPRGNRRVSAGGGRPAAAPCARRPDQDAFVRQSEGDFPALVFRPTWLLFDGDILPEIKPAPLPGADAKELLQELGCSEEQIEELVEKKVVGKTLWAR